MKQALALLLCLLLLITTLSCSETTTLRDASDRPDQVRKESASITSPADSTDQTSSLPSIAELVSKVKPAVVSISVQSLNQGLFSQFTDEGSGTGIIIQPDGFILTNFHVIQNAKEITVSLSGGETYTASVIGYDRITDLAMIKIEAVNLPTITFLDSDNIRVGDWVIAFGNALALKGGPTVTMGIISAQGRTIQTDKGALYDLIQTDAAINTGNSGGPLIDLTGRVVGINTAILRGAQGIGFAVSSKVAQPIIKSLIDHGRVVRPLIGLTGADVTPTRASRWDLPVTEGIIITRTSRDGPAEQGGLKEGDIIMKMNGESTPDMATFLTLLWSMNVGQTLEVEFLRQSKSLKALITLTERPAGT